jgi:hypothetical protein
MIRLKTGNIIQPQPKAGMQIVSTRLEHYIVKRCSSKNVANYSRIIVLVLLIIGSNVASPSQVVWVSSGSSDETVTETTQSLPASRKSWYEKIETEWGGRLRLLGNASWHDDDSIFDRVETDPFYDGTADFRLKNKTYFSQQIYLTTHYEAIYSGGDTRQAVNELEFVFPELFDDGLLSRGSPSDDRRFFDFTHIIHEDSSSIFFHRLDRLFLTWQPEWGVVQIGRQAVTWGSGFLFNPFDLFNPFAPTDIIRDYKMGDDMINVQFSANDLGDFQVLYVARRNPDNDEVEFAQSSLAGKWHFAVGTTEFDIIAAEHFEDEVIGIGSTGYLKEAAWRRDATWTFLQKDAQEDGFLSLVANMDYSWVWGNRNFYGFIEFYFNGLGNENYSEAITDLNIIERINRGEIFTLGRKYLSGSIQVELHPLFNFFLTSINNIADPSGILQPYAVWNITEDLEFTFGGIVYWGGSETEYGGFTIPGTEFDLTRPDTAFLWLTYYF